MTGVDTERYMDAAAGLMGLPLADEWRPGVARFLDLAGEMANVLESVPLDDAHLKLGSVYTLPEWEGRSPGSREETEGR